MLLLFTGSELAWAYLWVGWLSGRLIADLGWPVLSWWLCALLFVGATIVSRLLLNSSASEHRASATVALCAIATGIGAAWLAAGRPSVQLGSIGGLPDYLDRTPAAVLALVVVPYFWWRGAAIARSELHFEDASSRLAVGVVACALGLALNEAAGSTLSGGARLLLCVQFFICILPALALSRLVDVRSEFSTEGRIGISREWLGVLGIVVAGIVVVTLLLASLALLDARHVLATILTPLANALYFVLFLVALPIGFLAELAIFVLRALIALLTGGQVQPFTPPVTSDQLAQARNGGAASSIPAPLVDAGKWILLALVAAVVVLIVARAVFRYQKSRGTDVEEVHESLWPGGSPWRLLLRWLARLLRRGHVALPAVVAMLPVDRVHDQATLDVRALYRRWLAAAAVRGRARGADETPAEFLVAGVLLLASAEAELRQLTDAYERARYGSPPLDPGTRTVAADAWQAIDDCLTQEARS